MPLTAEEIFEKQQVILEKASFYMGVDENRITSDKEDARLIREMLNDRLLKREFANIGNNGMGYRLFITDKGREAYVPIENEEEN